VGLDAAVEDYLKLAIAKRAEAGSEHFDRGTD
jgi:hypothetical protein